MSLRPLIAAGMTLGIGLGGFVDGIVFHQILQIHNMMSAKRPPDTLVNVEINMVWDGLFHALTWSVTAAGVWMLWRAAQRPTSIGHGRTLVGSLLMGWGTFNLVEGIINHHILHTHHVVERLGQSIWDWLFLASGAVFLLIGGWLVRKDRANRAHAPDVIEPLNSS